MNGDFHKDCVVFKILYELSSDVFLLSLDPRSFIYVFLTNLYYSSPCLETWVGFTSEPLWDADNKDVKPHGGYLKGTKVGRSGR